MRFPATRFLLLASSLAAFALPARAVIDKIEHPVCGSYRPTDTIQMNHHPGLNSLTIHGFGVDLAQRVTLSGIAGVRASLGRRQGGLGSNVEVSFTIPPDVQNDAVGRVTLHYPLGEDTFRIRVFSRPQLASITIDAQPTGLGTLLVLKIGREYTLTARGRSLAMVGFRPDEGTGQVASFRVESRDASQMRIRVRPLRAARLYVSGNNFTVPAPRCFDYGVVRLPGLERLDLIVSE